MCLCVPLQGYLLLLLDAPVGLLGCGYLLMLVSLLLLPPQPEAAAAAEDTRAAQVTQGRQQQQQLWRHQRSDNSSSSFTRDSALFHPLVPCLTTGSNNNAASGSSRWRWLLPLLLAALCIVDLLAQYVLVVGAVVQDQPLLPADVAVWIRDVIGINDSAQADCCWQHC